MIVAILAVLKAGGAYVPLDPSYPAARLGDIIQEADLKLVVISSHCRSSLDAVSINLVVVNSTAIAREVLQYQPMDIPPANQRV